MEHFDQYPLLTKKKADYILFCRVIGLMRTGAHLTESGLYKIVSIRAAMNRGLNADKQAAFPDVGIEERPIITVPEIINPHWVAGFANGDGSFSVTILEKTEKRPLSVRLAFAISQHIRDFELINAIKEFMGAGGVTTYKFSCLMTIWGIKNLRDIVIPFFNEYPLHGAKRLDYDKFVIIASMQRAKVHLSKDGIQTIRDLKATINTKYPARLPQYLMKKHLWNN